MTTLVITTRGGRSVEMAAAVETSNYAVNHDGVIEKLRETIDNQNKMIARMLNVQFGQYQDDYVDPDFHPTTDADKLAYILGHVFRVTADD